MVVIKKKNSFCYLQSEVILLKAKTLNNWRINKIRWIYGWAAKFMYYECWAKFRI